MANQGIDFLLLYKLIWQQYSNGLVRIFFLFEFWGWEFHQEYKFVILFHLVYTTIEKFRVGKICLMFLMLTNAAFIWSKIQQKNTFL